jgi:uncharacterized DUF497 family protein
MGGRGEWTRQITVETPEPIFEYDSQKSFSNKEKHGIDFEEAKALWRDEQRIVNSSSYIAEERYLLIAKINSKTYAAAYTMRNGVIRIISVRRARKNEEADYEK